MSMDQNIDGQQAAMVATGAPSAGSRLRQLTVWSRPFLVTAFKVGATVASTLAINALLLLIAVPIGIAIGQLFWSVAITELALLVVCGVAAVILAVQSRRSVGAGLIVGWAVGYVGLISLVVALIVAVIVIVALAWVVLMLIWALVAILAG
jgi:ABC-type Mn2+/Zn2+ transport system permease subunit